MKLFRSLIAMLLAVIMLCSMGVATLAYNDVANDDENIQAIEFVDRLGIITSTWNGDFKPEQYLTRADAVVAVYKMLYKDDIDPSLYTDVGLDFVGGGETGDIADDSVLKAYLCWAVDNYLVTTNVENSLFKPSEPITANELLTLLAKVLRLAEDGLTYPDDYVDAMSGIETGLEAGDTPVTREQAAVAFTQAIISSEGSTGEMGVYTDDEGQPLDSLAARVFNMSSIDLVIRATTNKKLGYNVENGTLLSNGADVDLGADLSEYVGYGIKITYCDADKSLTYTEDEEVLTYSVSSTLSVTVPLTNVSISSGGSATVESDLGAMSFATSTYLYLNDAPWPVNDEKYDLAKQVASLKGKSTKVINRPNLQFKCMQAETDEVMTTVFATESRPGKVMGINNGMYTIYDYYYAGTSKEFRNYNVLDCVFSGTVKVGDFVSFYEANGKTYLNPGNAVVTPLKYKEVVDMTIQEGESTNVDLVTTVIGISNQFTFNDDSQHLEHSFHKMGDCILKAKEDLTGPKYTFITDGTEDSYVITWEAYQTNYATLMIDTITKNDKNSNYDIKATNVKTGAEVKFKVAFDNVDSTTPLEVGDIITYTDDGEVGTEAAPKTPTVYVKKTATVKATVKYDAAAKRFTNVATGDVYLCNQTFKGAKGGVTLADGDVGEVTLVLDMANTVVYYK